MKKLFTSIFALLAVTLGLQAQIAWNQVKVSTTEIPGSDTVYFNMPNRGTGQMMAVLPSDTVATVARDDNYAIGDSAVWRVIKGAALGTSARIRIQNVKTGNYLYTGLHGGSTKLVYQAPRNDSYNGVKDFLLVDKGPRVAAEYYYNIADENGDLIGSPSAGKVGLGASSLTGQGAYMWRFNKKSGPQPKAALLPTLEIGLTAVESTLNAGGSVTLNAQVTKGTTDLLGNAILYHGTTIIDTLSLDANGAGSYVYSGLVYGTEKFALVYTDDVNYEPADSVLSVTVGPDINAKATKLAVTAPTTAELHSNVTLNITVSTAADEIVSQGDILVFVNGTAKNKLQPDVLGSASITFPNLLVGTEKINFLYVGDKMNYLDSDTSKVSIEITPSTSSVKPYPVYFDLCDQPEIRDWDRERGMTIATPRDYTHYFRTDSLSGITITDTISNVFKVGYHLEKTEYTDAKIDNAYNRADFVLAPLGSSRPTWIKFRTPWLNAGSYNIYLSTRVSGDPKTNISSVTIDDNELYFPANEMYGRWLKSWAGTNNTRRWNAKAATPNLRMIYMGSASVDNSGTHSLKVNVLPENGQTFNFDMLEFIPVDQDSLSINETAAVSMAKTYYPLFSWTGFAYLPGYDAATVATTYTNYSNFALPYQVQDQTDWGTTYEHVIDSVGIKTRNIDGEDYVANYVTVYRAEDQWTRVAEGYSDENTFNYTCNLPKGNYYYETILYSYIGLIPGAADYRTFINSGFFTVTEPNAVVNTRTSNIKAFGTNSRLTVKGINAGARIIVTDLTGRTVSDEVSSSDVYTKALYPSIYLVKVIANNDNLSTKVIIK